MYLINVYVPEDATEQVKAAMFAAGAGKLGQYDQAAWQTLGTGQFRPLAWQRPRDWQTRPFNTRAGIQN